MATTSISVQGSATGSRKWPIGPRSDRPFPIRRGPRYGLRINPITSSLTRAGMCSARTIRVDGRSMPKASGIRPTTTRSRGRLSPDKPGVGLSCRPGLLHHRKHGPYRSRKRKAVNASIAFDPWTWNSAGRRRRSSSWAGADATASKSYPSERIGFYSSNTVSSKDTG